ncbi:hypothetical protein T09_10163 [Trichinella sp. T9]|nr:hypothetical protein T09_10163 [Trichinella sp. T9]
MLYMLYRMLHYVKVPSLLPLLFDFVLTFGTSGGILLYEMNLLFPFAAMTCSRALANEWSTAAVTAAALAAQLAAPAPAVNNFPSAWAGALYKMALKVFPD